MKTKLIFSRRDASALGALVCLLLLCLLPVARGAGLTVASTYTMSPPALDGQINWGEWAGANQIALPHGFVAFLNDDVRLYMLIDVLNETTFDSGDYFWVTFDVNNNSAINANVDLNYGYAASTRNMRFSYYLGANTWTTVQPNTFSARGEAFTSSFADGSIHFSFFPPFFTFSNHRVYELGIDLAEINATPGGTARMGIRVASPANGFTDEVPAGFGGNFANLTQITLAPRPFPLPANPAAVISLQANPLEVTQSVQDRQNTLPLVQNKQTLSRVYVNVAGVASAQPVWSYVYGSRGGADLPGSPLARVSFVPTTINRRQLSDTPSFTLPSTWPAGSVDFKVKIRSSFGAVSSSGNIPLTFTPKEKPTYWVVPLNTGTTMSPTLVANSEITSQENNLQAMYPLASVNWVHKPWTDVGVTTAGGSIAALKTYWNNVAFAWLISVIFTGKEPYALPAQIYGMLPSGGGLSDPVWFGGDGRVARGFQGTSIELTMAHEITHNLDRDPSGTWGHHTPFGCGATGPDPAWPYPNSQIQEVGFDSLRATTPVPENFPDYMSYCQSGALPTKWITPYHWTNLFKTFATVTGGGVSSLGSTAAILSRAGTMFYISGEVHRNGTGRLNPVFVQMGLATENIVEGKFAIELLDATGKTLQVIPFIANFVDVEGERLETVPFSFQVPAVQGVATIVLRFGDRILHLIRVSRNAPEVFVVTPNGGEEWKGFVAWEAKDDDQDPLTFNVLYTPDDGQSWYPLASGVEGHSLEVDTSNLPGGEKARIKVIANDGFNTTEDESDGVFALAGHPPQIVIVDPHDGALLPPTKPVHLEAQAQDPEDGVLSGNSIIWSEGNIVLGSGSELDASFAEGDHIVTATAMDSAGNSGRAQVKFRVSRSALAHLNIEHLGQRGVRLSWPAITGAVLESSRNVTGPYEPSSTLQARLEADQFVVDIDPNGPTAFFRLELR